MITLMSPLTPYDPIFFSHLGQSWKLHQALNITTNSSFSKFLKLSFICRVGQMIYFQLPIKTTTFFATKLSAKCSHIIIVVKTGSHFSQITSVKIENHKYTLARLYTNKLSITLIFILALLLLPQCKHTHTCFHTFTNTDPFFQTLIHLILLSFLSPTPYLSLSLSLSFLFLSLSFSLLSHKTTEARQFKI